MPAIIISHTKTEKEREKEERVVLTTEGGTNIDCIVW